LGYGREIQEQFLPFGEQKKHLAKLHEFYMVDLPAFDHSRLLLMRASRTLCARNWARAVPRIAPLASLALNRILEK
jgi:hypothetical protein